MKYFILISLFATFMISCQKEEFNYDANAKLLFSTDTLTFDTVFTTIGSATLHFKVYNPYSKSIKISRINLAGGDDSPFHLNIDGFPGNNVEDVDIPPNDSIFIFVEVNVDPVNQNMPLVINDSVIFETNNNLQYINLVAFGQDVHLINGEKLPVNQIDTIWTNDKPYLIYNSMLVDTLKKLTIESGCHLYFHYNSSLLVKGTLVVNGNKEEPVIFEGDRLESFYDDIPGQWGASLDLGGGDLYFLGGIHLLAGSRSNQIQYAIIRNGTKGIQADSSVVEGESTLVLSNSIIDNMSITGYHGQGSTLLASNCVISNCGAYTASLTAGGHYEFYHCTLADYFWGGRRTESLLLNNYFRVAHNQQLVTYVRPLSAIFGNCIITGGNATVYSEVLLDLTGNEGTDYEFLFDHCILNVDEEFNLSDTTRFKSIIIHNYYDRLFKSNDYPGYDFKLDTLSIAKDVGSIHWAVFFPADMEGNSRIADGKPDLGAYERIE